MRLIESLREACNAALGGGGVALVLVAACSGSPAVVPPDAAPPDAAVSFDADPALACLGAPAATSAPDPIAVGGKLFEVVDFQVHAVAGATVELRARADESNLLASATTADDGSFTITVASGGAPVDAVIAADVAGDLPTREIPADRLIGGENVLLVSASSDEVARWQAAPYDPAERTLLVGVADCDGAGARGATVATTPTSAILYYDDQAHAFDATLDASTNGFALVPDAPAAVTVGAAVGSASLPARAITTVPGTLTIAEVSPRR